MARKTAPVNQVEDQNTETENTMEPENTENVVSTRTEPVTLAPLDGGNNVLAAWRGLYLLFGAQADRFDITPDGVVVVNFSLDGKYNTNAVIHDISERNRHVPLVPAWFYLNGEEPEPFTTALEMTKWMAQYFRREKQGDEGKSPQYVKDAIAEYKKAHSFPARKGRTKRTFKIEQIGEVDTSLLAGVSAEELTKLREKIDSLIGA